MKLLTVTINDNIIETLDFERIDFTNSFILPSDTLVNLLTVPMEKSEGNKSEKGVFVQNTVGRKCLFPSKLEVIDIKCDEENLIDYYEVEIEFNSKGCNGKALSDETGSYFVFHEGVLTYNNIHPERVSNIKVNVTLQEENAKYTACRTIFLSPAKQVDDVILDFGSEATQLSISNRGTINDVKTLVSLFEKMWGEFGESNKKEDIDMCMQRDASDGNLYRSRFFVKKKIDHSSLKNTKASVNPKENQFIKLLTLSKEGESLKENYIPLPNTKIASFGGVAVDKVDVEIVQNGNTRIIGIPITNVGKNFFYRSSINAFLRKAVDEIGLKNLLETETPNKIRLISFHILMPNVYDYCKIHEMLEILKKDLLDIIRDVNSDIIGFDLTAVSESDASLLGNVALSRPEEFPAGRYLILDAGRGTLDFSIVKHDNETELLPFQNLYRDGIIGAGNALTYAMLLVILEGIVSSESAGIDHTKEIQEYIFSNILGLDETGKKNGGGDSAKLVELMELVDKYKIMYSDFLSNNTPYSTQGLTISNSFKELRLEGLVRKIRDIVENGTYIEDSEKYLERSMRQLVDAVIGRLNDRFAEDGDTNKPNFVVFAGRGFMFKPFKEMMEESLTRCFPGIEKKHFSADQNNVSDKNVCLVIANYLKDGDYDSRLLGQPYMLHSRGTGIKNVKREEIKEKGNNPLWSKLQRFLSGISHAIGDNSEIFDDFGGVIVHKGYRAHKDMHIDDFCKGVCLRADYSNDQILIGNIRHKLPNSIKLGRNFDLFFANGLIWIRPDGGRAVQLDRGIDFGGNRIFESLFPYVNVTQPEKVAIPCALADSSTYIIPEARDDSSNNEETQIDGENLLI
jgi:hypothetical protein